MGRTRGNRKTPMPSHAETRLLPYSAAQMYDLVADVAQYPQFIPWIMGARVRSVTPQADGSAPTPR